MRASKITIAPFNFREGGGHKWQMTFDLPEGAPVTMVSSAIFETCAEAIEAARETLAEIRKTTAIVVKE